MNLDRSDASGTGAGEERMGSRRAIRTDQAPAAIGPYSQAIWDETAGMLFCSGQIGIDPARGELVPGGVLHECRQALRNCAALLEASGLTLGDVVRVTIFLADMQDFAAVNVLYAEVFAEPFPARSTVAAAGLPKGARVEIECTALARR
jgi:2-iminobutanoate/2-iminopropanoate deaminase